MLWPLTVVLVANTNGRLAIPALAGLLVLNATYRDFDLSYSRIWFTIIRTKLGVK